MRSPFVALALTLSLAACATGGRRATFVAPPAEPPPNVGCTPASELIDSDNDLARIDPAQLTDLCVSVVQLNDAGRAWVIQRFRSGSPGPLWIVPHDDENSAIVAGIGALRRHGGVLVAIDNNGARTNFYIDPNRIFGSYARCHVGGSGPVAPLFTQEVLRYRFAGQPIIALHTNMPGYEGDGAGGQGNTSILLGGTHRTPFLATTPYPGSVSPSDTLVFLAGLEQRPNAAHAQLIAQLNSAGINVMYEHVDPDWTDCSLSNFALLSGLGAYINIETVEGDAETHARLIDEVMRLLAPAVS